MTSKHKHMQNISIMWLYRSNVWNLVGNFITLTSPQFLLDYNVSIPHIVKPTLTEYLFALKNKK